MTEEELLRDVLAIQIMSDPQKLNAALSGNTVSYSPELLGADSDEEMSREEFEELKQSQKDIDEMDAELERIFKNSAL